MRRTRGLGFRFLTAQLVVVVASLAVAAGAACLIGPRIFREHLLMVGHSETSPEILHVEQAYREAGVITLVVALATATACAVVVSLWGSHRLRVALGHLTATARGVARSNYSVRVPSTGTGTEVDCLAGAFNTMADRLEHTEDTRRRMLSDLAHEMSTPVSVLSVYVEGLQDGVAEWNRTTSDLMSDQLARLTRLVEDLDDVSRAEEGRIDLDTAEQPIGGLVRTAAATAHEAYHAKDVRLDVVTHESNRDVVADGQRIGQVLGNLLSNALRHTPPGGRVTVTSDHDKSGAPTITVSDTGEGLPPDQLDHILERFYRSDTSRTRDREGSGVGLTISRALIEAHGGTLTGDSAGLGQGSSFIIRFPLAATPGDGTALEAPAPDRGVGHFHQGEPS